MTKHTPRLVAELTLQEEVELRALEASIRDMHRLAALASENAKQAAKMINSIRKEAERGLQTLLTVNVGDLDPDHRRHHVVQIETLTRTLAAVNRVQPQRPM